MTITLIPGSRSLTARMCLVLLLALGIGPRMAAEQCANATEMDAASRSAIERAALQLFDGLSKNNAAAVQQNSIASLAANFAGLQNAMAQNQPVLTGAQATVRTTYLLDTGSSGTIEHAEFLCGIWGTPHFVSFAIPNLPAGKYGLVIEDVQSSKGPYYLSLILQQEQPSGAWKLAGWPPPAPAELQGHDAPWYLTKAREFKSKGQVHNAWFYYQQAKILAQPVAFMTTTPLVKLDREVQQAQPADIPAKNPVTLAAGNGKTYNLTQMFPVAAENGMDLVVKYSSTDLSDTAKTFQDNMAVISAVVGKYPEFREIFQGVVARAVDPAGHDYGTLLAMKDVK